jgi:hypothetical protein
MPMEIQILAWDTYKNVERLNWLMISPYLTVYTVDKKNIKDFVRKMLVSTDTMYKMVPSFLPWH